VDPAFTSYIATLQSVPEKAWEVLATRTKLQQEWDLACEVAIKADPSIDAIVACVGKFLLLLAPMQIFLCICTNPKSWTQVHMEVLMFKVSG